MALPTDSERIKNILWFSVSTAIFALLISFADTKKILSALSEADPFFLSLSALAGIGIFFAWSSNWYNFFRISGIECSYGKTFQMFSAGQLLNSITPLGQFGGQPFMAYLISRHSETRFEKSMATVMSADLIALIPMTSLFLTGYSYLAITGTIPQKITSLSIIVFGLLLFGLTMGYIGWYRTGSLEKTLLIGFEKATDIVGAGESLVVKLEERLENVEKTFEKVGQNPKGVLVSLVVAHVSFMFKIAAFYGILFSLGIQMNFFHVMLVITLSQLANFSPTPGGAGTFEAAMAGIILLFINVQVATAVTAAILYRASTYWLGIILGYTCLNSLNYSISDIKTINPDKV